MDLSGQKAQINKKKFLLYFGLQLRWRRDAANKLFEAACFDWDLRGTPGVACERTPQTVLSPGGLWRVAQPAHSCYSAPPLQAQSFHFSVFCHHCRVRLSQITQSRFSFELQFLLQFLSLFSRFTLRGKKETGLTFNTLLRNHLNSISKLIIYKSYSRKPFFLNVPLRPSETLSSSVS